MTDSIKQIPRMAFSAILLLMLTLLVSSQVKACDCYIPDNAPEAMDNAAAVFKGEVKQLKRTKKNGDTINAALIEVQTVWKGTNRTQEIVYTDGSSCHFDFEVGEEYLLYPYERDGELHVINCGRSASIQSAQDDLQQLGAGEVPTQQVELDFGRSIWPAVVGAIGVIVAAVVFLFWVMKRKYKN